MPEFAGPERSSFGLDIRLGVERALAEFADRLAEGAASPDGLDRAEAKPALRIASGANLRHAAALDAVQAALRLGARMTWQCLAQIGTEEGIPAQRMYLVAEAVFVYGEELADQVRAAHTEARARTDREVLRRRRRLVEQLVSVPGPSRASVSELARAARWPLPATVRVVALRRVGGRDVATVSAGPLLSAGFDALVSGDADAPYLIVPETGPRALLALARELTDWSAAVGPPVTLEDAGRSLRWARRLLDLADRAAVAMPNSMNAPNSANPALLHCTDHLSALLLSADEPLMRVLVDKRLAPLDAVPAQRRDRLAETLLSWLECRGSAPEVARRLGVHAQTVRYRLRHLEELFGDALQDPDSRYELELALRGRALLHSAEADSRLIAAG
ncbi:helix-turn-helix domain-containing protein [Actinocrinis sp.]|uniref:PucR family transcriptional regulator n=1 Tax=Actinocrinis sp. TaxID=1920516 RepID=UPI002D69904C|nr:helix-turn-helix domain-containing protein [Actinocrinis sp.]HZP54175.1 helix-turn-helix domain-containing protein [Actinocrinis sp.]